MKGGKKEQRGTDGDSGGNRVSFVILCVPVYDETIERERERGHSNIKKSKVVIEGGGENKKSLGCSDNALGVPQGSIMERP